MAKDDPEETTVSEVESSVAEGKSGSTPFVALGATALIIAVLFLVALGVVVLAYVLAG